MSGFQILVLLTLTCLAAYDTYGIQIQFFSNKVIIGFILGLVFGDIKTGLYLGGTIQLMSMGVVGLAGASVPDYTVATLVAVPIAIKGGSVEAGLAIGIPVAMLSVQFDIIHKIANGFVARWSQNYANKKQFGMMTSVIWLTVLFQVLKYLVPVALATLVGVNIINDILAMLPDWFMGGLSVAGKILPVVGIAILMNYMPTAKHFQYLIVGFVLFAYLNVPMLGVALVGVALAINFYKNAIEKQKANAVIGGLEDE